MRSISIYTLLTLALATPAVAHPGMDAALSFGGGVAHPLSGLDHITAMVAVGLWAAVKGERALWAWPSAFVALMLAGGMLGLAHVHMPLVEPGILASVVVLGLMVALAVKPPVWAGAALIGVFAVLHGHTHGAEVAHSVNGLGYVAGFTLATLALHAAGVGLAFTLKRMAPHPASRLAGAICTIVGLGLCASVL